MTPFQSALLQYANWCHGDGGIPERCALWKQAQRFVLFSCVVQWNDYDSCARVAESLAYDNTDGPQ